MQAQYTTIGQHSGNGGDKMKYLTRHEDGYRYVRSYWTKKQGRRVALYERQNGHMVRVGTIADTMTQDDEIAFFLSVLGK